MREELNTSVVNRIQKKCKIIPVVLDACDVPASLRATKWITIQDTTAYEAELNEVVNAIFGHYERPPVGAPLAHIRTEVQPLPSLTKTDTLVLKIVGEHVLQEGDYMISPEGIGRSPQALEIGPESLRESLEILQEEDYLRLGLVNSSGDNLHHVSMTPQGLAQYCEAFVEGYEPMVRQIGYHLLNQDDKDSRTIANALKRPHLIVRNVPHVFDGLGLIRTQELPGGRAYVNQVSPKLKRWLAE